LYTKSLFGQKILLSSALGAFFILKTARFLRTTSFINVVFSKIDMKGMLMLSGGIDSPVAGYLMKQKNVVLIAVHFSQEPFTDHGSKEKAQKCAHLLGIEKCIVVVFGDILAEIVKKCKHKYYYIISRRLMLRVAETLAVQYGCSFIVTGESMGQVGSQTLSNMSVTDQAVSLPVVRPLLGFDKIETISIAQQIGTYDLSLGPEMCSLLGPKHPVTHSSLDIIELEEGHMDMNALIVDALRGIKRA